MKKITHLLTFAIFFVLSLAVYSQEGPVEKGLKAINKKSVKAQLEFLASDWMEGRATGTQGEFLAGDYLASMLQFMNIDPAGDEAWTDVSREDRRKGIRPEKYTSYFQNYYLTKHLESESKLSIINEETQQTITFNEQTDFSIADYPMNINISSPIVFVGYGFQDEESGYDDFKGINVKNKIILRLFGHPGHLDTTSVGYKKFHQETRYFNYYLEQDKNTIALEKGAIGVINIYQSDIRKYWAKENDFLDKSANETPKPSLYDHKIELVSTETPEKLLNIYASNQFIKKILDQQNITLENFEKQVANSLKSQSKELKDIKINIDYNTNTELIHTRNILGIIEGENPNEIVVIGAHYDHVGMNDGFIWNGADDNASGTVGVWMLAKAFKASGIKPKKTIVFAAWSGEELGLYGSEYFTNHPYGEDVNKIKFYLNFDMISKAYEEDSLKNRIEMIYTDNELQIDELTKQHLTEYNLNLDVNYTPAKFGHNQSDHASFKDKNIPVMYFCAGYPSTLHTPKDETSDIRWNKMVEIIQLSYLNLWKIINE
ncbi:MAG: M20/M25/M40 family metallo-hydrolase [Bacteroidetes bacterium]|nr:M20/M25/M40 family metallo-hydrolase [Bacteroidota bacterium]